MRRYREVVGLREEVKDGRQYIKSTIKGWSIRRAGGIIAVWLVTVQLC